MRYLVGGFFLVAWICGAVMAKAGWLKAVAVVFPFYSWYLVAEKVMTHFGWL